RRVEARARRELVLEDERVVLLHLDPDERRADQDREEHVAPEPEEREPGFLPDEVELVLLYRGEREHHGHARADEQEGVEGGEPEAQGRLLLGAHLLAALVLLLDLRRRDLVLLAVEVVEDERLALLL